MTASQVGYAKVHGWVKQILADGHATVTGTVAWVVLCLLVAQRLNSAALARALPAEAAGSERSRLRRVRRWWSGPELDQATLTPRLIQVALALLPPDQATLIALATTRVGGWEVWQAGVVFAGHTLRVGWAVLPYPWPKGKFRGVTLALIEQLQAAFGPGHRWVLVADRGFPNAELFTQLLRHQTDWTVRLRLSDWVEVGGVYALVANHLEAGRLVAGQPPPAGPPPERRASPGSGRRLWSARSCRCSRCTSAIPVLRGSARSAPKSGPNTWRRRGVRPSPPAPGPSATSRRGSCSRRRQPSRRR
jgi:hypothetical protein